MIPRIIHQMWIGNKSERPVELMQTWKDKNPDCEYRLWTEKELDKISFYNKYLIELMPELSGKCDIMRYQILNDYGGFFVDADTECLNTLDDFFFENTRFTCWENEKRSDLLACSFMGCIKGDKLYLKCMEALDKIQSINNPAWVVSGPKFFTDMVNKWEEVLPMKVYPSWYFIPEHGTGEVYDGDDKVYARHFWGSTFKTYGVRMNSSALRDEDCLKRETENALRWGRD